MGLAGGTQRQKWYGGIIGYDGNIYGIPQCASGVLNQSLTQECTVVGKDEVSSHGIAKRWAGMAVVL